LKNLGFEKKDFVKVRNVDCRKRSKSLCSQRKIRLI